MATVVSSMLSGRWLRRTFPQQDAGLSGHCARLQYSVRACRHDLQPAASWYNSQRLMSILPELLSLSVLQLQPVHISA